MKITFGLLRRITAAGIHLLFSGLVALLVAGVVFLLWYPSPYSAMSGGAKLFFIVISVDIVLGPILTFVIFDILKNKQELIRDIGIVCMLQLAGLSYGVRIVFEARPVALVFEESRFRIVSAFDVAKEELPNALEGFRTLSLTGPRIISTRQFKNQEEKYDAASKALSGTDIGARPSFWQPYSESSSTVLGTARTVDVLYKKYPAAQIDIDTAVKKTGRQAQNLKFMPVITKDSDWVVLLDAQSGEPVGFLEKDGFFLN